MTEDEVILKDYADAGLEVPKDAEPEKETTEVTEVVKQDEPVAPTVDTTKEPEQPKEQRKRSIYDDLKDKKSELKSERTLREEAEKERDDWKQKFDALNTAKTPEEKQEAKDEIAEFAAKIEANPDTVREMQALFLKGVKQPESLSEGDRALLKKVEAMEAEKAFDQEFTELAPSLKEHFPNATEEEKSAIKKELYKLAHTTGWNEQSLDYILYKNKSTISAFVSPKKRGVEGKSPKDTPAATREFDPNADIGSMSNDEFKAWEEQYRGYGKTDGLTTDAQGRKVLI